MKKLKENDFENLDIKLNQFKLVFPCLNLFFCWALENIWHRNSILENLLSTWLNEVFVFYVFLFFFHLTIFYFYLTWYLYQIDTFDVFLYNFFSRALLLSFVFILFFFFIFLLFWRVLSNLNQMLDTLLEFPSFFNISPVCRRMPEWEASRTFYQIKEHFLYNKCRFFYDEYSHKKQSFLHLIDHTELFKNCYAKTQCKLDFLPLVKNEFELAWTQSLYKDKVIFFPKGYKIPHLPFHPDWTFTPFQRIYLPDTNSAVKSEFLADVREREFWDQIKLKTIWKR